MRSFFIIFTCWISSILLNLLVAQATISIIQQIQPNLQPAATIQNYWLQLVENGMAQPVLVPIMIAKGKEAGPTLGLVAAIHGNELNGIPIIQSIFRQLDVNELKGTIIAVPGLNVISINQDRRRFVDEEDLNRLFPGKEKGNRSQQFVYQIRKKLLPHFDYMVDMHTASFGRINSLYVRADLENDTIAQMAHLQDCDIILHGKGLPSTGDSRKSLRTFRAEAMLQGIPTITVEYANPQVYQSDITERGINGIQNLMRWLDMIDEPVQSFSAPIVCKKSYWVYVEKGGLLEIPVRLKQVLQKGDLIGVLRSPFGAVIEQYYAPEEGVVIGKSTNPVNLQGGRILHLGIVN